VPVILSFCHVLSCSVVFCLEVCGFEPNQSRWLSGFLGAGPSAFSSRLQTRTDSWRQMNVDPRYSRWMCDTGECFDLRMQFTEHGSLHFPPFAASRPPSILLVACSCLGNQCAKQRRCWTFCFGLNWMLHVLYVYHQLHTISYIDSRKQSPQMILFVGHFLTWKLDEIGPRFTAIDAIMPGVAKIRATVWRLEKIQPLNPLNSTGVVTVVVAVVHSCRLQRFCDTGAFATICPLNQLFPTTIIQFCVLCSGICIRCIKSSGNIRSA
jgi:hypothetical protein